EPHALDELSAEERKDCLALWHEVRVVLNRTIPHRDPGPKPTDAQRAFRTALMQKGRLEEARIAWQSALKANPPEHDAWYGYAELGLYLGQEDEYRRARRALLERFGATTNPFVAERTGRACLLMPASGDELRQAVALTERAVAERPGDRW